VTKRVLRIGLAAAVLWLVPGTGAARTTEMLSLTNVTCGSLTVTGTGLPGNAPVTLLLSEQASSPVVRSVPLRTSATGTVRVDVRVSLAGFDEVSATAVGPQGDTLVIGSHQFARPCPPARAAGALATTGVTLHQLGLLLVGLGLLALGALVRARTAYRGTHARGTYSLAVQASESLNPRMPRPAGRARPGGSGTGRRRAARAAGRLRSGRGRPR